MLAETDVPRTRERVADSTEEEQNRKGMRIPQLKYVIGVLCRAVGVRRSLTERKRSRGP